MLQKIVNLIGGILIVFCAIASTIASGTWVAGIVISVPGVLLLLLFQGFIRLFTRTHLVIIYPQEDFINSLRKMVPIFLGHHFLNHPEEYLLDSTFEGTADQVPNVDDHHIQSVGSHRHSYVIFASFSDPKLRATFKYSLQMLNIVNIDRTWGLFYPAPKEKS